MFRGATLAGALALVGAGLLLHPTTAHGRPVLGETAAGWTMLPAEVGVCFRPGPVACDAAIVQLIGQAARSLDVQAYSFTHPQIAQAVAAAARRGVAVRVLLDASQETERYSVVTYLRNAAVPVRIDRAVAIAHDKLIVIDGAVVIGGSYNFTASAERRNAENVTVLASTALASQFTSRFAGRWAAAAP